jgi:hypothetical protein
MPAAALVDRQTDIVLADQIRIVKVFDWLSSLFVLQGRKRAGSDPELTR